MKDKILRFLSVLTFFWFFVDAVIFRLSAKDNDFRIWVYLFFIGINAYLTVQELKKVDAPRKYVWIPAVLGAIISIVLAWK